MHHAAYSLSKNALAVQGRRNSSKIGSLVLSRAMSRTTAPKTSLRLSSTSNKSTTNTIAPKKQQKPLHSSAKTEQSTPPLSMEQEKIAETAVKALSPPSMSQLKILFTASAVPMIGFGFMDNLVMIQAGQFIDNTIGVTMGLATMTAAAAGQVVSDVSGVIFGGSLERFLHRYKLIKASSLTSAQRALPICRNVALFGAVCGVALGCGLGASCLLFMDLEARERAERAIQLQRVLNDMMLEAESEEAGALHCESCTIHLSAETHFSTEYTQEGKTKVDVLPKASSYLSSGNGKLSLAEQAAKGGKSVLNDNGSTLCTPIASEDGEVVAVLEFHIRKDAVHGFAPEDEKAAKVMARHIGIFMHRLSD